MPKFAPNEQIVEAFYFNGTSESAVSLAKSVQARATMTFDDSMRFALDDKPVPSDSWVFRGEGDAIRVIDGVTFSENYTAVGVKLEVPAPRPRPPVYASDANFRDGDIVTFPGADPKDTYEVTDIEDGTLICDSEWGEKRIPIADAIMVKMAAR